MENSRPFFSIIVPVYNSEEYLSDTIKSVSAQAFKSFELLLINDGSTDGSEKIAEDFIKTDKRIKLFNKENGGVSSARNEGINNATGEYLIFIDSDDKLGKDALSEIFNQATCKIDLMVANAYCEGVGSEKIRNVLFRKEICYQNISLEETKERCQNLSSMCIGIYRREFLIKQGLLVDENLTSAEDTDFFFSSLLAAQSVKIIECELFEYRHNEDSVSNNLSYKQIRDVMCVCRKYLRLLVEDKIKGINQDKAITFFTEKYLQFSVKIGNCQVKEEKKELLDALSKDLELLKKATVHKKLLRLYQRSLSILGPRISVFVFCTGLDMKKRIRND